MKNILIINILLFYVIFHISGFSQEVIVDTEFEINPHYLKKDNNGDIIATAFLGDTNAFWRSMIIKITTDLDTTIKIIDDTLNRLFGPKLLITQNNRYIVNAVENVEGTGNKFDRLAIMVFDEELNMMSFKRYNMAPLYNGAYLSFIQNEDGRIYGFGSRGYNNDFLAMEITEMGDTLRTKRIHSTYGGALYSDVLESHTDSIAFYGFIFGFTNQGMWKVITVDMAFDFTLKDVVLEEGDLQVIKANWINDSIYMGVGFLPYSAINQDLVLYKANAKQDHELVGTSLTLLRPDTTDTPAINIPTYVDPGFIYVGSYRGSSPGASYNGRYMVAVVDGDLNLKGMKSFGKDGFQYEMHALQATDDLGCIAVGTVNDYLNSPSYDWDMFIRKIEPETIVEVAEKTEDPDDSDYFVYPNPASDILYITTARKGVILKILDINGKLFLQKQLENKFDNKIEIQHLPAGNYILNFTDKEGYGESIKWIKK